MLQFAESTRAANHSIGFVPTMGALHKGHISLINRAKKKNKVVVVSVFVNPTQFNNLTDLKKYPRTFENDKQILEQQNVDAMFFPGTKEVYPTEIKAEFDLEGLDIYMEGPNRPGHFNGVVQVVTRFFDLVKPTHAYFGEKDFQQLAIIRLMTRKLKYDTIIIGCPTLRETDGLAMSSRNVRLDSRLRKNAVVISECLCKLKERLKITTLREAKKEATTKLSNTKGAVLEYLELVDPETLRPIDNENAAAIQACVALTFEGVRLIDNMRVL